MWIAILFTGCEPVNFEPVSPNEANAYAAAAMRRPNPDKFRWHLICHQFRMTKPEQYPAAMISPENDCQRTIMRDRLLLIAIKESVGTN